MRGGRTSTATSAICVDPAGAFRRALSMIIRVEHVWRRKTPKKDGIFSRTDVTPCLRTIRQHAVTISFLHRMQIDFPRKLCLRRSHRQRAHTYRPIMLRTQSPPRQFLGGEAMRHLPLCCSRRRRKLVLQGCPAQVPRMISRLLRSAEAFGEWSDKTSEHPAKSMYESVLFDVAPCPVVAVAHSFFAHDQD